MNNKKKAICYNPDAILQQVQYDKQETKTKHHDQNKILLQAQDNKEIINY